MNEQLKRRKEVRYETNVARCETCISFVGVRLEMKNSAYARRDPQCKKNNFSVRKSSLCDLWQDKHGKVMEADA